MSISVMASVTTSWSNCKRSAPLRRTPFSILIMVSLCLIPNVAFPAWFSPQLERIENCSPSKTVLASTLKNRSITSTLYVTHIRDDHDSETAQLFRERSLAGEIAYRPVYPSDIEVKDSQSVRLTGVVYIREASSLETFFSGTETQRYYEVKMDGQLFALNDNSFKSQPF